MSCGPCSSVVYYVRLHRAQEKSDFPCKNSLLSTNHHGYRRSYTPYFEPLPLPPWAYNSTHPFPSFQPYQIVTNISLGASGVIQTRSYNSSARRLGTTLPLTYLRYSSIPTEQDVPVVSMRRRVGKLAPHSTGGAQGNNTTGGHSHETHRCLL